MPAHGISRVSMTILLLPSAVNIEAGLLTIEAPPHTFRDCREAWEVPSLLWRQHQLWAYVHIYEAHRLSLHG